jgi:hypothetical protein
MPWLLCCNILQFLQMLRKTDLSVTMGASISPAQASAAHRQQRKQDACPYCNHVHMNKQLILSLRYVLQPFNALEDGVCCAAPSPAATRCESASCVEVKKRQSNKPTVTIYHVRMQVRQCACCKHQARCSALLFPITLLCACPMKQPKHLPRV